MNTDQLARHSGGLDEGSARLRDRAADGAGRSPARLQRRGALAFLRADAEADRPAEQQTGAVRREYKIDGAADVAQSMRAFLQARLDGWR